MTRKQIKVIAESSATIFEKRANQLLEKISNPQITFDRTRPSQYTLFMMYRQRRQNRKAARLWKDYLKLKCATAAADHLRTAA